MSIRKDWEKSLKYTEHGELFKQIVQALHDAQALDGLTQQELAAKCGISPLTVNKWMNYGTFAPHMRTVAGVCRGLGLNLRIDKYKRVAKLKRAA